MVESDHLLLLATIMAGITLLVSVLVIAVRTRQIREQLLELDALKRSLRTIHGNLLEMVRIGDRTSAGLQELSGVGLHFRQIKREQIRLREKLEMISSAIETLEKLPQTRDEITSAENAEFNEIVKASRSLEEWKSGLTAVFSDAGRLLESEPIRDFIDWFGPQQTSYPLNRGVVNARPSVRSERMNEAQPEKSSLQASEMMTRL